MDYETIESAALRLPQAKRADLAARLISSLDDEDEEIKVEATWADEIERRVQQVDSGEVKLIPGEQVMEKIRSRLRR